MNEPITDGGPAFPQGLAGWKAIFGGGAYLRDIMAICFWKEMLKNRREEVSHIDIPMRAGDSAQIIAADCYHYADAMLAERSKTK